jgi:DNA-binding CsgD family transcriptional regulator
MVTNLIQLQPITQKNFFDYWDSKRVYGLIEDFAVLNFFKPFVDTIPKLALGEFYWQIFNNALPLPKILMLGGDVEKLTPFDRETLINIHINDFFSFFHPDDLKQTLSFISKAFEMLFNMGVQDRHNYNISIYTRIKNSEGNFVWNSIQYPALYFDENGNFLYGMVLYTNINHLMKPDAEPFLTILDSTNKHKQIFTCYSPENPFGSLKPYPSLSKREREVITLLSQGKASKQISDILGISKSTVDNHRQRLLKKFGVNSSAELITKALVL